MSRPDPKTLFEKLMAENGLLLNVNPKLVSVDCADGSVIVRPSVDVRISYTTPEPPEVPVDPHERRVETILDAEEEK